MAKRPPQSERAIEHRREPPKPPVLQTVAAAYRDVKRVIRARPVVVGSMIAILIAFNLGKRFFFAAVDPGRLSFVR